MKTKILLCIYQLHIQSDQENHLKKIKDLLIFIKNIQFRLIDFKKKKMHGFVSQVKMQIEEEV